MSGERYFLITLLSVFFSACSTAGVSQLPADAYVEDSGFKRAEEIGERIDKGSVRTRGLGRGFTTIAFDNILFEFNEDVIKGEDSFSQLNEIIVAVNDRLEKISNLQVIGHTDILGSIDYNQQLSEKRAASVMTYLKTNGVKVQLTSYGRGESEPLPGLETTEYINHRHKEIERQAPNRRVEIKIYYK